MRRTTFAAILAFLAAMGPAGAAPPPHVAVGSEWAADWSSKNLDAVMSLYDPNAEFMAGSTEGWVGKAAIRKNFVGVLAQYSADLHLHSQRSFASGDLAYDSGVYDETITSLKDHKVIHPRGNYLFVFRRQKTGDWKILEQTWTQFGERKL